MKKVPAVLALMLSLVAAQEARCATIDEYLTDTLLLPARTAAIGTALMFTTPGKMAKGACEMAASVCPDDPKDALIFEYAAVPLGFVGGAIVGSVDGAGDTIARAWDKPFSAESFGITE